jgi:hypothetical protein
MGSCILACMLISKHGLNIRTVLHVDFPTSPDVLKKFPYLKTPTLSEKRRERLLARLNIESEDMRCKWALLTDRTRESLIKQGINAESLEVVIKSPFHKLRKLLESEISITKFFSKLHDHLSFFDYKFIELIVRRYCPELSKDLEAYTRDLKEYCKRRVVEVPADVFKEKDVDDNSLFVKCDRSFEEVIFGDILNLESRLSALLGVDLSLLRVDDGCTELVFEVTCPVFPLTKNQRDQLMEMGILRVYTLHYTNSAALSTPEASTSQLLEPKHTLSPEDEISDSEMSTIAHEVTLANKVEELAGALEMTSYLENFNCSALELLKQWQEQATTADLLIKPYLMYHLQNIGMHDLHTRSVYTNVMSHVHYWRMH